MFRKFLYIVLCLFVLVSFNTPAFANELGKKIIKLQPSAETEKILEDVELIINTDNVVTLNIKGHKEKMLN